MYTYDQTGTGYPKRNRAPYQLLRTPGGRPPLSLRPGRQGAQSQPAPQTAINTFFNNLYDDLGRITQITYPDSDQVNYAYDTGGNISGVTGPGSVSYAAFTNFTGLSQPQGIAYGNGVTTSLTYNIAPDSRLHSMITTTSPAGGNTYRFKILLTHTMEMAIYCQSPMGHRTQLGTETFVYDGLSRLTDRQPPHRSELRSKRSNLFSVLSLRQHRV